MKPASNARNIKISQFNPHDFNLFFFPLVTFIQTMSRHRAVRNLDIDGKIFPAQKALDEKLTIHV